ncbi:MAG: hypothetical protein ABI999_12945 [Acidobacteriota bacterium]
MKHSKLGIASCIIAIAMFVLMSLLVGASYFVSSVTNDNQQIGAVWIIADTSALLLPIPVHIIGLTVGVTGVFMPNRKKLFPIIGTLLNLVLGIGSVWPWLYLAWHALGRVQ